MQQAWLSEPAAPCAESGTTLVRTLPAPLAWSRSLVARDEMARGELRVRSREGEACLRVGAEALRRGVLLGRYDRCDNEGVPVLTDSYYSRIHALVVEVDGRVHVVDAASKNGLWHQGRRVRRWPLNEGEVVELGEGLARVSWTALH